MIRIIHFKYNIEERVITDIKTREEALRHIKQLLQHIPIDHIMVFEIGVYSGNTFTAKEYLRELNQ